MTTQNATGCDIKAALKAQGKLFLEILAGLAVGSIPLLTLIGLGFIVTSSDLGATIVRYFFTTITFGFLGGLILWGIGYALYKTFQPTVDLAICLLKQQRQTAAPTDKLQT